MKLQDGYSNFEWSKIAGYEGLYEISHTGVVISAPRSGSKGGVMKQWPNRQGYKRVFLSKNNKTKGHFVHKLVALSFCGPHLPGYVVNHLDGNKKNNHHLNLEWCTREENEAHKQRVLGEDSKGIKNGNSILTENQVLEIRAKMLRGVKGFTKFLANKYGVNEQVIRDIWNRKRWRYL